MPNHRAISLFAVLLLAPCTALASSAVLVLIPASSLLAIAAVVVLAVASRTPWAIRVLAVVCALAASAIAWFIPTEFFQSEDWLNVYLMCAAFFPPLAAGGLIIWLARRFKTARADK